MGKKTEFNSERARQLVAQEAAAHGEIVADLAPHRGEDLQRQAHATLERAAVAVAAVVGQREIAMLALEQPAAARTRHRGRVAAPVLEQNHLFLALDSFGDGASQGVRQVPAELVFLLFQRQIGERQLWFF
mgnify:CR=1 FL=1